MFVCCVSKVSIYSYKNQKPSCNLSLMRVSIVKLLIYMKSIPFFLNP